MIYGDPGRMVGPGQDRAVSPLCHHAAGHVARATATADPTAQAAKVGRRPRPAAARPSTRPCGRPHAPPRAVGTCGPPHASTGRFLQPGAFLRARVGKREAAAAQPGGVEGCPHPAGRYAPFPSVEVDLAPIRATRLTGPARGQHHDDAGTPAPTDPRWRGAKTANWTGSMVRYA